MSTAGTIFSRPRFVRTRKVDRPSFSDMKHHPTSQVRAHNYLRLELLIVPFRSLVQALDHPKPMSVPDISTEHLEMRIDARSAVGRRRATRDGYMRARHR